MQLLDSEVLTLLLLRLSCIVVYFPLEEILGGLVFAQPAHGEGVAHSGVGVKIGFVTGIHEKKIFSIS